MTENGKHRKFILVSFDAILLKFDLMQLLYVIMVYVDFNALFDVYTLNLIFSPIIQTLLT